MNRITAKGDYDRRDATEVDGFHSEKARKNFSRLPESDPKTVAQLEADVVPDSDIQIAFRELRDQLEADRWWERDMVHEATFHTIFNSFSIVACGHHAIVLVQRKCILF